MTKQKQQAVIAHFTFVMLFSTSRGKHLALEDHIDTRVCTDLPKPLLISKYI
jgi:hypothetical protein